MYIFAPTVGRVTPQRSGAFPPLFEAFGPSVLPPPKRR